MRSAGRFRQATAGAHRSYFQWDELCTVEGCALVSGMESNGKDHVWQKNTRLSVAC